MKAISLWQPWASAIALGFKQVETRHWKSSYVGVVAIHAAKKWNDDLNHFARITLPAYGVNLPGALPKGALVATARIVGYRPAHEVMREIGAVEQRLGDYTDGRWAWMLADIKSLPEPIPFKGAQGFFDVPDELFSRAALASEKPAND